MRDSLLVLGSLNMDFVVSVAQLPAAGQTVLGGGFQMLPGGKGANQAYAAGRLSRGLRVRMAGQTGNDVFAEHLKASLEQVDVDVSAVAGTADAATGVAMIAVDRQGQNMIVVAPGANFAMSPEHVESLAEAFASARFCLFQLETPLETVEAAMTLARRRGSRTMLDPAPARALPMSLLKLADVLTPNETEAAILLGLEPKRIALVDAKQVARHLRELGCGAVALKLGDRGCYYSGEDFEGHVEAFAVDAKDATAAGDTFNAALAVALSEGAPTVNAPRFANAAAALSVTRSGAQASIPSREDVDRFLAVA